MDQIESHHTVQVARHLIGLFSRLVILLGCKDQQQEVDLNLINSVYEPSRFSSKDCTLARLTINANTRAGMISVHIPSLALAYSACSLGAVMRDIIGPALAKSLI